MPDDNPIFKTFEATSIDGRCSACNTRTTKTTNGRQYVEYCSKCKVVYSMASMDAIARLCLHNGT